MVELVFDITPELARKSGVYMISSNRDGGVYVGRTTDFMRRFCEHRNAIRYGYCSAKVLQFVKDNPEDILYMRLIELVECSRLAEREEFYIRTLDSVNKGLNTFYTDDELIEFARKFRGKKRKKKDKIKKGQPLVDNSPTNMSMKEFIRFLSKRHNR